MSDTLIQWDVIQERYNELTDQVNSASLESGKRHIVQKELSYLSTLLTKQREILRLEADKKALITQMQENTDSELAPLYEEELTLIDGALEKEKSTLDKIMFPADPLDNRSAFLEIRAGAG